jgi:hypothetical protein
MDDVRDAPAIELTYAQRLEALRVERSAGVIPGSIRFLVADDIETLSFDIETERTTEPPKADIRDVERIHFVYRDGRKFGETAPYNILCDRADFPRDIGHLCAGEPGCLAAPCLAVGGIQPLYERAGIEVLMERLRSFMRDAKTGSLMTDGWEPVPFAVDQRMRPGEVIPRFFQEHAFQNPAAGVALGVAINFERDGGKHVIVFPEIVPATHVTAAIGDRNQQCGATAGIPWIFVWPHPEKVETDPIFEAWRTGSELREGLKRIGVDTAYDTAVVDLMQRGLSFKCQRPGGGKAMVVVVGVWRPYPIMNSFFGYSDDPKARSLELRAYMVSQDLWKEMVTDDTTVEAIVGHYPPRPELCRWVSGQGENPPVAVLGLGALGSAIYNNLVRSGLDDVVVQDHDPVFPHNLARHSARSADLYGPKVEHAKVLMDAIAGNKSGSVDAFAEEVVATELDVLMGRIGGRLLIDATADERVRLRMDELRNSAPETLIRTEMFHEGRLGVTCISLPNGPSFSDMVLSLTAMAPEEPSISSWIEHEARNPLGPDPMLYGFGCTSQTVHLPNHVVEQQASVAMTAILGERAQSGILLNPLDDGFRPLGSRWLPIAPFSILVPSTEKEWTIRMSAEVIEFLRSERMAALPSETGGYLYGSWEPTRRTITIVFATGLPPGSQAGLPPGSQAGPTTLELGPAGRTMAERRLARKTRGRIFLCGTWHSHPHGPARLSGRDHKTMMAHAERDEEGLKPTLIVIVAGDEIQAHLRVP